MNTKDIFIIIFCVFSRTSKFGLKSVIHTSDPYVKMGAIIELYNFNQDFADKLLLQGSFDFNAKYAFLALSDRFATDSLSFPVK